MNKTAQQIADTVLRKLAFAVTEEGHEFDADVAAKKRKMMEDIMKMEQEAMRGGYWDDDNKLESANFLRALRFGGTAGNGLFDNPRHQAYIEKKHREGGNAWNPFGGMLTPTDREGPGANWWAQGKIK